LAALVNLLLRIFDVMGTGHPAGLSDALLPVVVLLVVLIILHLLIVLLLPLRWSAIRQEFHTQLEAHLQKELAEAYSDIPGDVARELLEDRKKVEKLIDETREVASWLAKREQSASVAGLYGN